MFGTLLALQDLHKARLGTEVAREQVHSRSGKAAALPIMKTRSLRIPVLAHAATNRLSLQWATDA